MPIAPEMDYFAGICTGIAPTEAHTKSRDSNGVGIMSIPCYTDIRQKCTDGDRSAILHDAFVTPPIEPDA